MWSAPDQNLTSPRNVTHIGSGHYQPTRLTQDGGTDQKPRRATGVPDGGTLCRDPKVTEGPVTSGQVTERVRGSGPVGSG